MTTENPAPESDNSAPAPAGDKAEHMIPKARLDEELSKRRQLEEQVSHMADMMLAGIPDQFKGLIPTELSPAAKVNWYLKAKETGVFNASATVPQTDNSRPTITPRNSDPNSLPANARIAAGYRR